MITAVTEAIRVTGWFVTAGSGKVVTIVVLGENWVSVAWPVIPPDVVSVAVIVGAPRLVELGMVAV